ncbi:MAG: hypothetical protein ABIJ56_02295 [Pseudomonadota bacterium]
MNIHKLAIIAVAAAVPAALALGACSEAGSIGDVGFDFELPDTIDGLELDAVTDPPVDNGCPEGETLCGGECVDTMSDPDNCGVCGLPCAEGQVCSGGLCSSECAGGLVDCYGSCVNTAGDPDHCGDCDTICPDPPNAEGTCVGGECSFNCLPGWSDVNGNPADGCEEACSPVSDTEECNGVDDNCNGTIDEGFDCPMNRTTSCTTTCGSIGTGICGIDCTYPLPENCTPPAESCNGVDDDCDEAVDNGFNCARGVEVNCVTGCGTPGSGVCTSACEVPAGDACAPGAELCNGIDDNCNEVADDGFGCIMGSEVSCTTVCGSTGTGTCSLDCSLPPAAECTPPSELCNGIDDDCDEACDNGFLCCRGDTQTQSCGVGTCGTQTRTCGSACTWGAWGECVGGGECTPGSFEDRVCGNCGTQRRTCSDTCIWSAYGTCTGQGECASGTPETRDCGYCGTQTRTCGSDCTWDSWGTCAGGGECTAGTIDVRDCGFCGSQSRTCSDSCWWGLWGTCTGSGECAAGTSQDRDCARCGTETRTCSGSCWWGSWGSCLDQGACEAYETGSCTVGSCPGTRTCSGSCTWGSCVMTDTPRSFTFGSTTSGNNAGAGNDTSGSCGGSSGEDVLYSFTLGSTSDVFIAAFSTAMDPVIYLSSTCGGSTWCNDDAYGGVTSSALIISGLSAGTYYLVVDAFGGSTGSYYIEAYSNGNWTAGDMCGEPIRLTDGASGNTSSGGIYNDYSGSCATDGGSGDMVYYFIVETGRSITIDSCDAGYDTVLYVKGDCDGSDLLCNDDSSSCGLFSTRSYMSASYGEGIYFLVVDGYNGAEGAFSIDTSGL